VPAQAGIFSVQAVTRATNMAFTVSTSAIPADQQATNLTARFTQSVYGIAALNETLPAFMARNYTLAPFRPSIGQNDGFSEGTYTGSTTMYTLDLDCTEATLKRKPDMLTYLVATSNTGCTFVEGLNGNVTRDNSTSMGNPIMAIKDYMAMYVGYYTGGVADFYLEESSCPLTANVSFYAAFERTKVGLLVWSLIRQHC
jgi:hypothetical protein